MEGAIMSQLWIAVIGTSAIAFGLKYFGHSVPEKYLSNPRVLRINTLIPIALLSALVAVQTFGDKSKLVIDQRLAGMTVAVIALVLKAPFPVVVIGSAAASALTFNLMK
jgi:branched-subunit amino acid transport protein